MGLTFSTETGTGSSQVYDIRWESELGYLSQSDVYVYYGDDYTQQQIPFTWVNATQIQLTANAASTFRIRRVVDRSKAVNDYVDGAILRDKNLDDSYAQALMILEEITDGWLQPNGEVFILNDLDMQNVYNVINIRDPEQDGDAVNLRHLNQELANANFQGVIPLIQPRQQGDGVTTVFSTPATVKRQEQSFFVNVDGIGQRPYTDYTTDTSGNLTFDEAPPKGADIDITLFEPNNQGDLSSSSVTSTGSTTPRRLDDRFADVVNVKDFGAVGDGVTDDTAAIQLADNAAAGGGTVYFPVGTYLFGSTVNKDQYTSWRGDTNNNYVNDSTGTFGTKFKAGFSGRMIQVENTGGVTYGGKSTIENIAAYGQLENGINATFFHQTGARIQGMEFKNLDLKRFLSGLVLEDASFVRFEHLYIAAKNCIDAPFISDSVWVDCELGSGLPTGALYDLMKGGFGLRAIGGSGPSGYNGNNRFLHCRFQLAADTYANLRMENMQNLRFVSCIFDQNESIGGLFKNCRDIEFSSVEGFNNGVAATNTPKWTLQFGEGGTDGCSDIKFLGGTLRNINAANNDEPGNGLLFSDSTKIKLIAVEFADSLVNKISGLTLVEDIYGCTGISEYKDAVLQNGWVENSSVSTPRYKREGGLLRLRGVMKDGTVTNGTLLFTIQDSAARPTTTMYMPIYSGPATVPTFLQIESNGNVSIAGGDWESNSFVAIDFVLPLD